MRSGAPLLTLDVQASLPLVAQHGASPGRRLWHLPFSFITAEGACLRLQVTVKWHQCRGHRRSDWVLERMWNWSWVSFGNRGGGQEGRRPQETSRGSAEAAGGWARTGVRGAKDYKNRASGRGRGCHTMGEGGVTLSGCIRRRGGQPSNDGQRYTLQFRGSFIGKSIHS